MATQYSGYAFQPPYNRWQDWANLILAIWLFISPWVLQFGAAVQVAPAGAVNGPGVAVSHAAWNAWVLGVHRVPCRIVGHRQLGGVAGMVELDPRSVDLRRTLGIGLCRTAAGELGPLARRRPDLPACPLGSVSAAQCGDDGDAACRQSTAG